MYGQRTKKIMSNNFRLVLILIPLHNLREGASSLYAASASFPVSICDNYLLLLFPLDCGLSSPSLQFSCCIPIDETHPLNPVSFFLLCKFLYTHISFKMGVQDYTIKALSVHNSYRARHGAPPLQWSHELRKVATDYAAFLASRGEGMKLVPKSNLPWGQNLFEIQDDGDKTISDVEAVERAIESWYSDQKNYNWKHPGLSGLAFSQLVWIATGKIGVGVARNKGRIVIVGFYDSPGNLRGDFGINVLPPLKTRRVKSPTAPGGDLTQTRQPAAAWVN